MKSLALFAKTHYNIERDGVRKNEMYEAIIWK